MPIRPELKGRYPANWKQIRESILTRAGQKRNKAGLITSEAACERCGLLNHSKGYRDRQGVFITCENTAETVLSDEDLCDPDYMPRIMKIVLTTAHIHDDAPENCDPENLQALCQRCHNTLDATKRAANRIARREAELEARAPKLF